MSAIEIPGSYLPVLPEVESLCRRMIDHIKQAYPLPSPQLDERLHTFLSSRMFPTLGKNTGHDDCN